MTSDYNYDDITLTLNHLKWKGGDGASKTLLLGHSLGGGLAICFGLMAPTSIDAIVTLDNTFAFGCELPLFGGLDAPFKDMIKFNSPSIATRQSIAYTFEQYLSAIQKASALMYPSTPDGSSSKEGLLHLLKRGSKPLDDGKFVLLRDPRTKCFYPDLGFLLALPNLLDRFANPTLILKPELGVEYFEPFIDVLRSEWPKVNKSFEFSQIKGQHHVHLDDPKECCDKICHFLKTKL